MVRYRWSVLVTLQGAIQFRLISIGDLAVMARVAEEIAP
jgi:hypothetical protein